MDNTMNGNWFPFGKPIKIQTNNPKYFGCDDVWVLAWRIYYEPQPKAFEPTEIGGIEYLGAYGDVIDCAYVEFIDNPGGEQ